MKLSIEQLTNVFAQGFKRVATPTGWIEQKYFSNNIYFVVFDKSTFGDVLATVFTTKGTCVYILPLNELHTI